MLFRAISRSLAPLIAAATLAGCASGAAPASPTAPRLPAVIAPSPTSALPPTAAVSATTAAPPPTPLTAVTPTALPPTSTVSPPTLTAVSGPISNQFEITDRDSGKTFTYSITSRFSIVLNGDAYPRGDLKVACVPSDALGSISNLPSVSPPEYAVRFEGVTPGSCTIVDRGFSISVQVASPTPAAAATGAATASPAADQSIQPGTTVGGSPRYLDDRSTPEEVLRSLFNAINRREYDRAYSYWEEGASGSQLPPYDQFKAGYANTASVELTLGKTTSGVAAGNIYFSVPTTVVAHTNDGQTQTFVGCYTLHLGQPAIQDKPPFQPMGIRSADVKQVPNDADTATLMVQACH